MALRLRNLLRLGGGHFQGGGLADDGLGILFLLEGLVDRQYADIAEYGARVDAVGVALAGENEIDAVVGQNEAARAGVNWIVVGSSVFQSDDPGEAYRDLQRKAEEALLIKV